MDTTQALCTESTIEFEIETGKEEIVEPIASPVDYSASPPPKYKCEMCGKSFAQLATHHIIPRFMECSDDAPSNLIEVCGSCHIKADKRFDHFIKDPWGERYAKPWQNEIKARVWNKRFNSCLRKKTLFKLKLDGGRYYYQRLSYNIKSGEMHILNVFNKLSAKYRMKAYAYRYNNLRTKSLFHLPLEDSAHLYDLLTHNSKTGHIQIASKFERRKRIKGNTRAKTLFHMTPEENVNVNVILEYNKKTGNILIKNHKQFDTRGK